MSNPEQQKRITVALQKELEALKLRPILYRIDEDRTTVALLLKKGTQEPVARGLSIQSPTDQAYRKDGNNRAVGRALKAVRLQESGAPIQPFERNSDGTFDATKIRKPHLMEPYLSFKNKRTYLPGLTPLENELLAKLSPKATTPQ